LTICIFAGRGTLHRFGKFSPAPTGQNKFGKPIGCAYICNRSASQLKQPIQETSKITDT
jgi:hypothetical protein